MSASAPTPSEPAIQGAARLLAEGQPAEAAERLAALVAEAPAYAAAHVLRATALEAAGRIDEALVSWGRAAALVPSSPLVHRERERLLATRVADAPPAGLPPAVPDPGAEPAPSPFAFEDAPVEETPETRAPDEIAETEPEADAPEPLAEPLAPPDVAADAPDFGVGTPDFDTGTPDFETGEARSVPDEVEEVGGPLLGFGMPPEEPDPEPEPGLESEDEPEPFDYGAPQTLDASDLVFGDPTASETSEPEVLEPETSEGPMEAVPPADAPPTPQGASADVASLSPADSDWGADDTGLAPVLPPEADTDTGADAPEPDSDPTDELDEGAGWDMVSEADVPTPPPGTYAEPDVVPPEEPDRPLAEPDPFADVDAVVDEFGRPEEPPPDASVADELDALISQLEDAPRIRPDPQYSGPEVELDAGGVDDMASETLAKIYTAQHQYVEAAIVYEKLAARQPEQAEELLERAAELRQRGG